jgi:hypothetical protein
MSFWGSDFSCFPILAAICYSAGVLALLFNPVDLNPNSPEVQLPALLRSVPRFDGLKVNQLLPSCTRYRHHQANRRGSNSTRLPSVTSSNYCLEIARFLKPAIAVA